MRTGWVTCLKEKWPWVLCGRPKNHKTPEIFRPRERERRADRKITRRHGALGVGLVLDAQGLKGRDKTNCTRFATVENEYGSRRKKKDYIALSLHYNAEIMQRREKTSKKRVWSHKKGKEVPVEGPVVEKTYRSWDYWYFECNYTRLAKWERRSEDD